MTNINILEGFSVTCFVNRTIGIYVHIRRLLHLAFSSNLTPLSQGPTIQCCRSLEQNITINPGDALYDVDENQEVLVPDISAGEWCGHPHAELKVFATMIQDALNGNPPYWAIGASKLMCAGCFTMIHTAFSKVLMRREVPHLVRFLFSPYAQANIELILPGTSNYSRHTWEIPNLGLATAGSGFNLEAEMRQFGEEHIIADLRAYVEASALRPKLDSSVETGPDEIKKKRRKGNSH